MSRRDSLRHNRPQFLVAIFQYITLDSKGEPGTAVVKGKSDREVIQARRGRGFFPIEVFPARQRIIATFFMSGMVALTIGILLLLGEVLTELRSWILLIGGFIFLTNIAHTLALKLRSAMEADHY